MPHDLGGPTVRAVVSVQRYAHIPAVAAAKAGLAAQQLSLVNSVVSTAKQPTILRHWWLRQCF